MCPKYLPIIMFLLISTLAACGAEPVAMPTTIPAAIEEATEPAPTPAPSSTSQPVDTLLHVIYDDDGSPDGTTALLYLLTDPATWVNSATISYGEAHPAIYIQHIGRILEDFGITDIPLGEGLDEPLSGNNGFPEWLRGAASDFWGMPIPNPERTYPTSSAAGLMIETIHASPNPVTVFISGPCTNLAQALRIDSTIQDNIEAIYIMGGAVYVPGNVHDFYPDSGNIVAEWNIFADPIAASEVFASGIPLFIVPLDATNQVSITYDDTRIWRRGGAIADLAASFYDSLMASTNSTSFAIWDLMTAVIMVDPNLCGFEPLHLEVITEDGNTQGQTVVRESEPANAQVCLSPDVDNILMKLQNIFMLE